MFEVTVSGWFAAAHQLRLRDGALEPLHGHNWKVRVTFAGPRLNDVGVLVDFVPLKAALDRTLASLHDTNLNELPAFADRNPSTESVAVWIAEQLRACFASDVPLTCVEVEEAPGCIARYFPVAPDGTSGGG